MAALTGNAGRMRAPIRLECSDPNHAPCHQCSSFFSAFFLHARRVYSHLSRTSECMERAGAAQSLLLSIHGHSGVSRPRSAERLHLARALLDLPKTAWPPGKN